MEPKPYYIGGHCIDCGLNASRCDCGVRCPCGKSYRPGRGEKACHKLVPTYADDPWGRPPSERWPTTED